MEKCECAHFNEFFIGKPQPWSKWFSTQKMNSGDIAVSDKTFHKMMETSDNSNATLWKAYPDSRVDLWDQNFINGEYVIAYELNPGLHPKLQSMLPNVCLSK